jgi:hypothetical protein
MDEYFPIPHFTGKSDGGNGFDDPFAFTILHDYFHSGFCQHLHFIRFAPHLLFHALLLPVTSISVIVDISTEVHVFPKGYPNAPFHNTYY